jgi:MoxR-like ATPase
LKTIREESVRQLKDKQDLYEDGENIIKLGNHKFYVNVQNLALTVVQRGDKHQFHLTGTDFFEDIDDEALNETAPVWQMSSPAENDQVYRAEYLAYLMLHDWQEAGDAALEEAAGLDENSLLETVRRYMSPRYQDSYAKGVHDWDATKLLSALIPMHRELGLLRFSPRVRACGLIFWHRFCPKGPKTALKTAFASLGNLIKAFPDYEIDTAQLEDLRHLMQRFNETSQLFEAALLDQAATYLFYELADGDTFAISKEAAEVFVGFQGHLKHKRLWQTFENDLNSLQRDHDKQFHLCRNWLNAYLQQQFPQHKIFLDEICALLMCGHYHQHSVSGAAITAKVKGLKGSHGVLEDGTYALDYNTFNAKLSQHTRVTVPLYEQYQQRKQALSTQFAEDLRLDSFKPRVLTSFVRNKLIDQVYLPLIGANFAKQMGGAGENKRTDPMGLLLLISPPGYGKTTLMEYVCSRLGLVFMKINGPAIGHDVTSLDPAQAPHASAREELNKLNLALEMGDNVMIYLDDIQHCNPEFLQKFISLCDGQRKIEGVYKGKTRTYDLRGKKVCVVMAGNPYTETGEKFRIPDMLANRADTYNLGDIIGETKDVFELSYVENALTSNPVLERLASRGQADVYAAVKVAQTGSREGVTFEGNYSSEEISEFVNVLKKMLRIRDVILRVNLNYIRSAAMEDAYRTAPPFKLQGSYRNMNKIAEKVLPIMNDAEVEALLASHYEGEAQTLTTGAEANLLQFYDLSGQMNEEQKQRWQEICTTFQKKQAMLGVGADDKVGQVVLQLRDFNEQLICIANVLRDGMSASQSVEVKLDPVQTALTPETLEALRSLMPEPQEAVVPEVVQTDDPHKSARYLMKALRHQFNVMHHWIKPMFERDQANAESLSQIEASIKASMKTHKQVYQYLKKLAEKDNAPS